jgi:flagellar assembly protein FliH
MVKPSPESEKAIPLIATPGTPSFGEPAPEPAVERAAAPEPARSAFPPASAEIEKAQPVAIDRGPSPLEIARIRALEQRERQLEQSIEEVAELRRSIMAETEQQLVELAAAIAKRVIGRELSLDPEILLGLAAEGLDALAQGDKVKVRVGAVFDEASIASFRDRVKARASHVEVNHDDKLGPGGCVVEAELGRVDESVELRLASVLAHLFGQSEGSDFPRKGG